MKSSTYKIRDCFASLAMTTFGTFYETMNIGILGREFIKKDLDPLFHYSNVPLLFGSLMNVGDWKRKWSFLQPEKKALYFEDTPFTYQEVNNRVNQLCQLLHWKQQILSTK